MDNDIEFIKHIISVDDNEIEIVHDRPGCDTGMQLKLLDAILCYDRPGGRTDSPTMYFNTVPNPGGLGELPGSKLGSVGAILDDMELAGHTSGLSGVFFGDAALEGVSVSQKTTLELRGRTGNQTTSLGSQTTSLDVVLDIREPGGRTDSQTACLDVVDGLREHTCAVTVDKRGVLEEQAVSSYCLSYSIFHS